MIGLLDGWMNRKQYEKIDGWMGITKIEGDLRNEPARWQSLL